MRWTSRWPELDSGAAENGGQSQRLRRAGLVMTGPTGTPAFAYLHFSQVGGVPQSRDFESPAGGDRRNSHGAVLHPPGRWAHQPPAGDQRLLCLRLQQVPVRFQ